ncbi:uncharacterized protein [Montipora foliosa]|uniref:uncharacterized protein n=1 Tax=Montipora foliosa TaxID=591990 RepID=UPI0035F20AEB
MARFNTKALLLEKISRERQRRRELRRRMLTLVVLRKRFLARLCLWICLLFQSVESNDIQRHRSCRRSVRNTGWWELVWATYDEGRFKKAFRVSRETFDFILKSIRPDIEKNTVTEIPVSPECRLAICLYRFGRGDYLYTIAELFGLGVATVHNIVKEVCEAIIRNLWKESVQAYFPTTEHNFKEKMVDMEMLWQFPSCWGAIDGCHIPIQCPPGGLKACKEYHNFKNFYSIVMMAIVDAQDRFIWASVGFPGNSHDSVIFQSTELWHDITENNIIPPITKTIGDTEVYPMILGDSAFPFRIWLMKPYGNEKLTPEQGYFNYRLSRARMVTERTFGQLKSRWRVLYRKLECQPDAVKLAALTCIVLHNICIAANDTLPPQLDLTTDPFTQKRRSRDEIRELLFMRNCTKTRDSSRVAGGIREALAKNLWQEQV